MRVRERAEQGGNVFRAQERLVALHVDVDVRIDALRDGMDAVRATGKIGRCDLHRDTQPAAERNHFVGVRGDQDLIELLARAGSIDHPGEQGAAGYLAEDLAGQTAGGEAGGDDAEGAYGGRWVGHSWAVLTVLSDRKRFKTKYASPSNAMAQIFESAQ
jgi:hypothetical protein